MREASRKRKHPEVAEGRAHSSRGPAPLGTREFASAGKAKVPPSAVALSGPSHEDAGEDGDPAAPALGAGEERGAEKGADEEAAGGLGLGLGMGMDLAKLPGMSTQEMQELLDKFTPEQMSRYEAYRRSALRQGVVKRVVNSVSSTNVSPNVIIVLAGIAKLFVGELVETARTVMAERGDDGPIRPAHLREAHRRLRATNKIPSRSRPPLLQ